MVIVIRTYHSIDFEKYAKRYLAEIQYRFNRRFNFRTILPELLYAGSPPASELRYGYDWLKNG